MRTRRGISCGSKSIGSTTIRACASRKKRCASAGPSATDSRTYASAFASRIVTTFSRRKTRPSAIEYVGVCKKFCNIYKLTKSILTHGEDYLKVPVFRDGKDTGVTEEIKIGFIKFDNGSRILAFSSNPNAMRVFGGDVGLDEFAYHPQPDELWETAQGRITWGYDLGVWSSHNGTDTKFNTFAHEAAAGTPRLVPLSRHVLRRARHGPRRQDQRHVRARLDEGAIHRRRQESRRERRGLRAGVQLQSHWQRVRHRAVVDHRALLQGLHRLRAPPYGEGRRYCRSSASSANRTPKSAAARSRAFSAWGFGKHMDRTARHALGFDVAASGQGDLASIYIDSKEGSALRLRSLFTCRTDDWDFLETTPLLVPAANDRSAGHRRRDRPRAANLLARSQEVPGDLRLGEFQDEQARHGLRAHGPVAGGGEKQWPSREKDIAADFFALRKLYSGGSWKFGEGKNTLNPHSHCDIAWGGAMSTKAATNAAATFAHLI